MNGTSSIGNTTVAFLLIAFGLCISYTIYIPSQSDFIQIIIPYSIAFGLYLNLAHGIRDHQVKLILIAAVIIRGIAVFAFPNLSDDLFRFLWDANLVLEGSNPYAYLPTEVVSETNQAVFEKLNSQQYFSPYPPLSQAVYSIAAFLSSSELASFSFIVKMFTFLSELGSLAIIYKLLQRLQLPIKRIALYALNPLIIIELVGNLHFEAFMILFVLLSIYLLDKDKIIGSALSLFMAIAAKLLPLMFIPFYIKKVAWKKTITFLSILSVCLLVIFSPIWMVILEGNFLNSLDLYFRKFEFNASIYYVLRYFGYLFSGWNMIATIGPLLGITALCSICYLWYRYTELQGVSAFIHMLLFSFTIYLALATTVHPWYLSLPIALSVFTSFRYTIFWSGLIFMTYYNYSVEPYHENLWIVALEYLVVFSILVFELQREGKVLLPKIMRSKKPS